MNAFLEALMQSKGVSVYKMAKDIGIPKSTAYSWLYGECKPSTKYIVKLSSYFDVPATKFIDEA